MKTKKNNIFSIIIDDFIDFFRYRIWKSGLVFKRKIFEIDVVTGANSELLTWKRPKHPSCWLILAAFAMCHRALPCNKIPRFYLSATIASFNYHISWKQFGPILIPIKVEPDEGRVVKFSPGRGMSLFTYWLMLCQEWRADL